MPIFIVEFSFWFTHTSMPSYHITQFHMSWATQTFPFNNCVTKCTVSPLSNWFNFCLNITMFADFYSTDTHSLSIPLAPNLTLSTAVSFLVYRYTVMVICRNFFHKSECVLSISLLHELFFCETNAVTIKTSTNNFLFFFFFLRYILQCWHKQDLICEIWEKRSVFTHPFSAPFKIALYITFSHSLDCDEIFPSEIFQNTKSTRELFG